MSQEQTIIYGKLVRDRIPEIIETEGSKAKVRVLDESEPVSALTAKLVEEAEELRQAPPGDRLGELADVYEVLAALVGTLGLTDEQVQETARLKRTERGGFSRRLWLEEVSSVQWGLSALPSQLDDHR
ncbi:phosphoribosyl-ATP pyrophosphohydrolase [Herbidospora galbida]|uniref:Phosphoribosyl-ATP pyrophosphohydrolase n=1 Tax=Herbidospora galbida TaxID=2575442 RepID=A0A4V5V019_9ACTN|nr:phosphoribosyl-ATP pyrophosphohydrolase [Herbidospora galbida]